MNRNLGEFHQDEFHLRQNFGTESAKIDWFGRANVTRFLLRRKFEWAISCVKNRKRYLQLSLVIDRKQKNNGRTKKSLLTIFNEWFKWTIFYWLFSGEHFDRKKKVLSLIADTIRFNWLIGDFFLQVFRLFFGSICFMLDSLCVEPWRVKIG